MLSTFLCTRALTFENVWQVTGFKADGVFEHDGAVALTEQGMRIILHSNDINSNEYIVFQAKRMCSLAKRMCYLASSTVTTSTAMSTLYSRQKECVLLHKMRSLISSFKATTSASNEYIVLHTESLNRSLWSSMLWSGAV